MTKSYKKSLLNLKKEQICKYNDFKVVKFYELLTFRDFLLSETNSD